MATPHLKIDPDDCSGIGLLVLEYIEKHQLTFTEISERIGISRSALRLICLKQGNPGKRTVPKLGKILNQPEPKLCRMICANKLRQMYGDNDDEINATLEVIDSFVKILDKRLERVPEKKPNEYDLYHHAMKSVTRFPGCSNHN